MEWLLKILIQYFLLPLLQSFISKQVDAMRENGEEKSASEKAKAEITEDVLNIKAAQTAEEALDALTKMAERARARRKSYGL